MKKQINVADVLIKTDPSAITYVSSKEAIDLIKKNGSTFFTLAFTKRTDNTLRVMNARTGVKKGLKNTGKHKTDASLMLVYDMTKRGYRTINVSGIRWLKLKGKTFIVVS